MKKNKYKIIVLTVITVITLIIIVRILLVQNKSEYAEVEMNNCTERKSQFLAKDKHGKSVVLEWYKTNIVSPDFAATMKNVWPIARDAYTPIEMQFLKAFPEVVRKEPYFKPFESLFKNGVANVDWKVAEETMESILHGHFVFDPAKFSDAIIKMYEQDSCFVVTAKDNITGITLGFITFLMRTNYVAGDIKSMSFAVDTAHQNRGLGKLLMSSIFKILPNIKRIFLGARVTNDTALKA